SAQRASTTGPPSTDRLCQYTDVKSIRDVSYCLKILFLITPPPPRSTLFPYTTLFRSASADPLTGSLAVAGRATMTASAATRIPGDRKSTRLNSSHQIISYAVFCLKKRTSDPAPKNRRSRRRKRKTESGRRRERDTVPR